MVLTLSNRLDTGTETPQALGTARRARSQAAESFVGCKKPAEGG